MRLDCEWMWVLDLIWPFNMVNSVAYKENQLPDGGCQRIDYDNQLVSAAQYTGSLTHAMKYRCMMVYEYMSISIHSCHLFSHRVICGITPSFTFLPTKIGFARGLE